MKVGIAGCGTIAAHHLNHLVGHPSVQAIHLMDRDPARAEALARRFRVDHVSTDLPSMYGGGTLDAVHVLTPPASHAAVAMAAMERGSHVLVEKPMALSEEECRAMIESAERHRVTLCVNHNLLFDPLVRRAGQAIAENRLGRVLHVEASFNFDLERIAGLRRGENGDRHWLLDLPGGPLTDSLPHPASLVLHFLPDVEPRSFAVTSSSGMLPGGLDDELRILLDAGGTTGFISVSFGGRPDCITLTVVGTEASAHLNLTNMTYVLRAKSFGPKKLQRALDSLSQARQTLTSMASGTTGILLGRGRPPGDVGPLIDAFYRSLAGGGPSPVPGREGRRVARLISGVSRQLEPVA